MLVLWYITPHSIQLGWSVKLVTCEAMIGPGRSRWKIDEHSQEAEREEAQLSEERISQGLIEGVDYSIEREEDHRV